jgi:hypothetical protein
MRGDDAGFRVYVRDADGVILPWTDTITPDPGVAENAILDLRGRTYLLDSPCVLVAAYGDSVYFTHAFDTSSTPADPIQSLLARLGRLDWLNFPLLH